MSTADGNIQREGAQSEKGCIPAEEHEKKTTADEENRGDRPVFCRRIIIIDLM